MKTFDRQSAFAALSSTLSLAGSLKNLLAALGEDFPAEGVFADTYYPELGEVRFLACATRSRAGELTDVVAVEQVEMYAGPRIDGMYVVDDIAEDPFTAAVAPKVIKGVASYVMVPVQLEGRHLGVVCFYSSQRAAFNTDHVEVLGQLRMLLSLNVGFARGIRLEEHNIRLEHQNRKLAERLELAREEPLTTLLANSPSMAELEAVIRQAARFDVPVLVTGESGTGKEVVARAVHRMSERSGAPFVRVNCSAIPEALIESELFGYEQGAFTDARQRRKGLFEQAEGGTLFLDEIGELPVAMQAKLLHAVQDRVIRRVGSNVETAVNVRIISATNRNLLEAIEEKRFRLDLYYRLNVLCLTLRPLRERECDLRPLVTLFASEAAGQFNVPVEAALIERMIEGARGRAWPGNVRELKNAVLRTVLASVQNPETELVIERDEALNASSTAVSPPVAAAAAASPEVFRPIDFVTLQREYFTRLLAHTKGRIAGPAGAAEIAGLHPNTLRSRLQKIGVPF